MSSEEPSSPTDTEADITIEAIDPTTLGYLLDAFEVRAVQGVGVSALHREGFLLAVRSIRQAVFESEQSESSGNNQGEERRDPYSTET